MPFTEKDGNRRTESGPGLPYNCDTVTCTFGFLTKYPHFSFSHPVLEYLPIVRSRPLSPLSHSVLSAPRPSIEAFACSAYSCFSILLCIFAMSSTTPLRKSCLKCPSPMPSPALSDGGSSQHKRKNVVFNCEEEEVFTADDWDRTPSEPSLKLSYRCVSTPGRVPQ